MGKISSEIEHLREQVKSLTDYLERFHHQIKRIHALRERLAKQRKRLGKTTLITSMLLLLTGYIGVNFGHGILRVTSVIACFLSGASTYLAIRMSVQKSGLIFFQAFSSLKATDSLALELLFLIPRKHRSDVGCDLLDDIAEMRQLKYRELRIKFYVVWQFFLAVFRLYGTKAMKLFGIAALLEKLGH